MIEFFVTFIWTIKAKCSYGVQSSNSNWCITNDKTWNRKNTTRKEPCKNFDTYVVLGSSSKSCVIVHFKLGTESNRYKSGNNKTVRRELQGIEPIERVLLSNQLHTVIQGHHKTIPNFFSDAEISNYIIFCAERLKKQVR
mgnify:CR=1 FL=1